MCIYLKLFLEWNIKIVTYLLFIIYNLLYNDSSSSSSNIKTNTDIIFYDSINYIVLIFLNLYQLLDII